MVTFIILINTERTKVNSVAEAMVNLEQVSEVFSVSGNYLTHCRINGPSFWELFLSEIRAWRHKTR